MWGSRIGDHAVSWTGQRQSKWYPATVRSRRSATGSAADIVGGWLWRRLVEAQIIASYWAAAS